MLQHSLPNAAALEEKHKTGSSSNAAALANECRSIGMKNANPEKWQNGECRSIEQRMPRHWSLKLKKNKEFDFY